MPFPKKQGKEGQGWGCWGPLKPRLYARKLSGSHRSTGSLGFGIRLYNQTYARTRVERARFFFSCPFSPQAQDNKQKMAGNGPFFSARNPGCA